MSLCNKFYYSSVRKDLLVFVSILLPLISFSQTEARAEINVLVDDFFELASQKSDGQRVDMFFNKTNHFLEGVNAHKMSHLLISSTVSYNLVARAALENFRSGSKFTFPVSVVKIEIDNTDMYERNTIFNTIEELQTNNQPLITNGSPDIDRNVNVKYSIPAPKAKQYILKAGAGTGTYSNTIIYTLSPK